MWFLPASQMVEKIKRQGKRDTKKSKSLLKEIKAWFFLISLKKARGGLYFEDSGL